MNRFFREKYERLLHVVELKNKVKKTEYSPTFRITEQQIWALTGGPFLFLAVQGPLEPAPAPLHHFHLIIFEEPFFGRGQIMNQPRTPVHAVI